MISIARILAAVFLLLSTQTHGAPPSMAPATALRIIAIELDGKSVPEIENVTMQELPEREKKTTKLAIDTLLSRGAVVSTPARTSITFRSINDAVIHLEPDSELYVDAVIAGGEIYELGRGMAQFETTKPLRFFVVKHRSILATFRQAKTRAEVIVSRKDNRFSVERGAIEVEERLTLLDVANNRRIATYESNLLESGQSHVATDEAKRKERYFDNFSAAEAFFANKLREAEGASNIVPRQAILRQATGMALGFNKTNEAIQYNSQWLATGDDNLFHRLANAEAIAGMCEKNADNTCAIKYYENAIATAGELYPDGLHFKEIKIREALAGLYRKSGDDSRIEDHIEHLSQLKARVRNGTPVSLIKRGAIKYPPKMREWGVQGDGKVHATITGDGKVIDVKVIQSPHPAFERAIVKSVLSSEYKPGTRDGKPVSTRINVPFSFKFDDGQGRILAEQLAPFAFPNRANTELPTDLQYDEPPGIKLVGPIVYPRDLLMGNVTGRAKVAVGLNDRGFVRSIKILEASHPDFGAATKAMMLAWEFSPAKKDTKPVATAFVYEQKFHWSERDVGVNNVTRKLLDMLASNRSDIAEMESLDARPNPLYQPPPVDPRPPIAGEEPVEEVVIEFFIDPEGGVQLPRIVSAKDMALGWAAATAVQRWIFEVPTVKGEPVFARRELRFAFK